MKTILAIISIFMVMQVSRESAGGAILLGAFCFIALCWRGKEKPFVPDERSARVRYNEATKIAREQQELLKKSK